MNPRGEPGAAHLHAADPAVLYRHGLPVPATGSRLREVLAETLATPGALTRLRLGLLAGEALGLPAPVTRAFATALEYFHTASLMLDDLPCMDDARHRRHQPCVHHRHGEAAAILGALAFINRGYALVWEAFAGVPETRRAAAAGHVEACLGPAGVLDGQSLDLHFSATDGSARMVARAALGKTVALLRLTFVTPALLAGVAADERRLLDRLAIVWGLAYQIADDCLDVPDGATGTGKTTGRDASRGRPNFLLAAGPAATAVRLERLLGLVRRTWNELTARRPAWHGLGPLIVRLNQTVVAARAVLDEADIGERCA